MKTKTEQTLEEMTYDELVDLVTREVHSALIEGGGKRMKGCIYMWLSQAILWNKGQK